MADWSGSSVSYLLCSMIVRLISPGLVPPNGFKKSMYLVNVAIVIYCPFCTSHIIFSILFGSGHELTKLLPLHASAKKLASLLVRVVW